MKYPLNTAENPNAPKPYKCSGCGEQTKGSNFLTLNGGILPSEDNSTFLAITSHHDEVPKGLSLIEDLDSYQYEFYFCSSVCIRRFFNTIVDDLEKTNTSK